MTRRPIVRIGDQSARLVSFSKRKDGLMKKASELVTLCGAEVMVLTFSPGGKPFSFSHPSRDAIIQKFLGEQLPERATDTTRDLVEAQRSLQQRHLNFHLTQVNDLVHAEIKKGKEIDQIRQETEGNALWERPINEFNERSTLEFLFLKFKEVKDSVDEEVSLLLQERESNNGCVTFPSNVMGGSTYVGPRLDPKGKGIVSGPPTSWVAPYDPMAGGSTVPSNVMGGSTYVGPRLDPKGKGIVSGLPSSRVAPYDPMVGGSSVWTPVYPIMNGFNDGVSYAPMLSGSSSQTPIDPLTIGSVPFDPMVYGSSIGDPLINGFDVGAPYAPLAGSSSQVPLDSRTQGFYEGQQFDPMEAESSGLVPSDQMWMGSSSGGGMSFNPNAHGPSNGGDD